MFNQVVDVDPSEGNIRVRYIAEWVGDLIIPEPPPEGEPPPEEPLEHQYEVLSLEINASRHGIIIVGNSPRLTDLIEFSNRMRDAHYQYQSLKENGRVLTAQELGSYIDED